jgi:hypothetical protein
VKTSLAAFLLLSIPFSWPVFDPVSEHAIVNSPESGTDGFPFPALVIACDFSEEHVAAKISQLDHVRGV